MQKVIQLLKQKYPQFSYVAGNEFQWSSEQQTIFYSNHREQTNSVWSLLHELGHALLGHASYQNDVDLLLKESAAWIKAVQIGDTIGITIDTTHVENCLDSYRDWLYKRSICPVCTQHGVQQDRNVYTCLNCRTSWSVGDDRFCRSYRKALKKTP